MSLVLAPSIPSTEVDTLFLQSSFILSYTFPEDAFIVTPLGTVIDPDLATTLWTTDRLIGELVHISDDVREYCRLRSLDQPPSLFTTTFQPRINLLRVTFPTEGEARAAVRRAQEEGLRALRWLAATCAALQRDATESGYHLSVHPRGLIDYYRCITWPGYDAFGSISRALVPFSAPTTARHPASSPIPPQPYSPNFPFFDTTARAPPPTPALAPMPDPVLPPALALDALLSECINHTGHGGVQEGGSSTRSGISATNNEEERQLDKDLLNLVEQQPMDTTE